jgi:hypothetical protein|tara:strand:+ start:359 stop:637 length:279 start_codon:yes stop_codon:yes gene_type:complete
MGELVDMTEIRRQIAEVKRVKRLSEIEAEKKELKLNLQAIYVRLSQLEHSEGWLRRASEAEQPDTEEDEEINYRQSWWSRLLKWLGVRDEPV